MKTKLYPIDLISGFVGVLEARRGGRTTGYWLADWRGPGRVVSGPWDTVDDALEAASRYTDLYA